MVRADIDRGKITMRKPSQGKTEMKQNIPNS